MKTFLEWMLNEMPLGHYGHDFVPDELRSKPPGRHLTWGGEETLDDRKIQVNTTPDGRQRVARDQFTDRDKRLITSPKTMKTLEEKLSKIGVRFNIIFIENRPYRNDYAARVKSLSKDDDGMRWVSDNSGEFTKIIDRYLAEKGVDKRNSITFVQPESSGHMLTPWMILHRIGHALLEGQRHENVGPQFEKVFVDYFDMPTDRSDPRPFWKRLGEVFMFKSIRNEDGRMNYPLEHSVDELIHELVAEYLWHGRIRVAPGIAEKGGSWFGGDATSRKILKGVKALEKLVLQTIKGKIGQVIIPN